MNRVSTPDHAFYSRDARAVDQKTVTVNKLLWKQPVVRKCQHDICVLHNWIYKMITLLFVLSAFFIGFGLNSESLSEIRDAITSMSIGVAIFVAYLTHLFSKNREQLKEYEFAYSLICGICNVSGEIVDVVRSSKNEAINNKKSVTLMPAVEIYNICSEDLLNICKEDVYRINSNKLSDSGSVIAVLRFKMHFCLFSRFVVRYMNMSKSVDKETRNYLSSLLQERKLLLDKELWEEADKKMQEYNEYAVLHFNNFCDPVLTQYKLMLEQKQKLSNGMKKAKKIFF